MCVAHLGGQVLERDSKTWQILRRWIKQNAPGPSNGDAKITRLRIRDLGDGLIVDVVQPKQLAIEAAYSDGSHRNVTRWCRFETNNATVDGHGVVAAVGSEKAAISVNYQGQFAATVAGPFRLGDKGIPLNGTQEPQLHATTLISS